MSAIPILRTFEISLELVRSANSHISAQNNNLVECSVGRVVIEIYEEFLEILNRTGLLGLYSTLI